MDTKETALRILRRRQVEERTGLSRSTIYDRIDPKSPRFDSSFPKPYHLGNGRAVGWRESDIDSWISAQLQCERRAA